MQRKQLLIIALFTISFSLFSQSGKLEKGKESLKSEKSSTKSKRSSSSTSRNNNSNDNIGNPFIKILYYVVAYTAYGVAFESPFEFNGRMHDAEIAHFPYEKSSHGNFIYTDDINYNITRFDISNNFVIENSKLYGNNFGVDFRFFKRFALDLGYLNLTEKINSNKDHFSLYSALLKYHRIRTQKLDAWFGLGIMHVGSDVDKSGFGAGVGAEWFVKKPISLKFSHKWTNINSQEVNNTKLLLKYHIKKYHISSGYEHFKIGVSKINAFSFGIGVSL